jgi:outer membrane protein TolC
MAPPAPPTITEGPTAPPLTLDEVLFSSERTYPPFLAVLQERAIASGDLLSARGAFDLNLNADSRNYPLGYYDRSVHDVFLEQPLRWHGAKVFDRLSPGARPFPNYYNYLNTRGGGAFVAGFDLPLLRNREIDARRAKEVQAELERRKVEPTILKQRIDLFKNVSKLYWNWVAAGQVLAIYRDLVRVAEARNEGLDRQLREGLLRAIDLVDFRRILLSREQQAVAAERRFQQAAIEMSLFYRNDLGFPLVPDPARLPREFPAAIAIDPRRFPADLEVALRLRPEALSVRLQAQKAQVDRRFARNQLLPSLNLYVYTEQNVGNRDADLGKDFRPFIMESSLLFDVPCSAATRGGASSPPTRP